MKVKMKTKKGLRAIAFVVLLMAVAVLGTRSVVQASPEAQDLIVRVLASQVEKTGDSKAIDFLGNFLLGSVAAPAETELGLNVLQDDDAVSHTFENCLRQFGTNEEWCEGFIEMDIPTVASATTSDAFYNNSGHALIVDYAEVQLTGTVSSTFIVNMGTSTVSAVPVNSTSPPSGLIDGYTFSTSTANVVTDTSYRNLINSHEDQGTLGEQTVQVPDSSYILLFLDNNWEGCNGSYCESVTSSARGYDGSWRLKYHYIRTL